MSEEDEAEDTIGDETNFVSQPKQVKQQLKAQRKTAKSKKKKAKLAKELSDLVCYVKSVHFKGLDQDVDSLPFWEMSSFGESKARALSTDPLLAGKFVARNTRQLARTYPAGSRINSSNYNPQVCILFFFFFFFFC